MACVDICPSHTSTLDTNFLYCDLLLAVGFVNLSTMGADWKDVFESFTDVEADFQDDDHPDPTTLFRCLATMLRKKLIAIQKHGEQWSADASRLLDWLCIISDHGGDIEFVMQRSLTRA